ncbi:MAG: Beta-barrel assembly-enhancing protease [Planctomycetes bacterium]|nr:Beta-barrel assembly-enhancing protease [Planctomycetota bacterium]
MARLSAFVAFAAAAAVFAPAWNDGFLSWDDEINFVENTKWKGLTADSVAWAFTTFHTGPWQPLSWLSYSLDHAVWGDDPRGIHVTNILLQALAGMLLVLFAWRILPKALPPLAEPARAGMRTALALGAGLFWAIHPQRVESVAWATERRDVLSAVFLVAAALAWLRHTDEDAAPDARPWFRRGAYWGAAGLYALSLMSKATAMGFAGVLVLLDLHPLRRGVRKHLAEKTLFLAMGVAIAGVALIGQRQANATISADDFPLPERLLVAAYSVARYLGQTFVPMDLRVHYERPPLDEAWRAELVVPAALAVAGIAALWFARKRLPGAFTSAGAFLLLLAPVSGLATVGTHLVADRYSHQPTLGLGIFVAGAVGSALLSVPQRVRTPVAAGAACAWMAVTAATSVRLASIWGDPVELWGRVLRYEPRNWLANGQIGVHFYRLQQYETARPFLHQSYARAPRPERVGGFVALNDVRRGDLAGAKEILDRVLERNPYDPEAWQALGEYAMRRSDPKGAEAAFREGLAVRPGDRPIRKSLAELLARSGRAAEAETIARELLAEVPRDPQTRIFLGTLLADRGAAAEAEAEYREALELAPRSHTARNWLAALLARTGRSSEAEAVYRESIALREVPEALGALAAILAARGEFGEAATLALRAAERADTSGDAATAVRARELAQEVAAAAGGPR